MEPNERSKFPGWKEKYKELGKVADKVFGNNDGKVSYNEACLVLGQVIMQTYLSFFKSQPQ